MVGVCAVCSAEFEGPRNKMYCSVNCKALTGKRGVPCSQCRKLMYRSKGSLPPEQMTCRPCRRNGQPIWASMGRATCQRCATPLTPKQRRDGGKFCSRRCAYAEARQAGRLMRWAAEPEPRRLRRYGSCRPYDNGWLQGPCRNLKLSVFVYPDGTTKVSCPGCCHRVPLDVTEAWCSDCAARIELHAPFAA